MAPRAELSRRKDNLSPLGVIAPPPIHVQSPKFEGSLGTLFLCVREGKVDLVDVALSPICLAYFEYMLGAGIADIDEAATALGALAYLLERKAWMLLPNLSPEPELEMALELPPPSIGLFSDAIFELRNDYEERAHLFFRSAEPDVDPFELPYSLENVSLLDLSQALQRLLKRANPDPVEPLNAPRKSLHEVMSKVLLALTDHWVSLDTFFKEDFSRTDAVYWFLALLELMRLGQAKARMNEASVEFSRGAHVPI